MRTSGELQSLHKGVQSTQRPSTDKLLQNIRVVLIHISRVAVTIVPLACTSLFRYHEVAGSIPGLAQWLRIRRCCELWCRSQTRLGSPIAVVVCRLAAVAPIRPLAWELPYALSVALKSKQNKIQNVEFPGGTVS